MEASDIILYLMYIIPPLFYIIWVTVHFTALFMIKNNYLSIGPRTNDETIPLLSKV